MAGQAEPLGGPDEGFCEPSVVHPSRLKGKRTCGVIVELNPDDLQERPPLQKRSADPLGHGIEASLLHDKASQQVVSLKPKRPGFLHQLPQHDPSVKRDRTGQNASRAQPPFDEGGLPTLGGRHLQEEKKTGWGERSQRLPGPLTGQSGAALSIRAVAGRINEPFGHWGDFNRMIGHCSPFPSSQAGDDPQIAAWPPNSQATVHRVSVTLVWACTSPYLPSEGLSGEDLNGDGLTGGLSVLFCCPWPPRFPS